MESISSVNQPMNASANGATLKGKVNALEETIRTLIEELNFYKKEIGTLRTADAPRRSLEKGISSEKEGLDDTLTRKAQEIRKQLTNEVLKAEEEMKGNYLN